MSLQKTPLQVVKEKYGDKNALVERVLAVVQRPEDEDDEAFKARVKSASNKKLIRMLARGEELKSHGGHQKLVAAVANAQGRSKDADYVRRLGTHTVGRLLDLARRATGLEKSTKQSADSKKKISQAKTSSRTKKAETKAANEKAVAKRVASEKAPKRRTKATASKSKAAKK